MSPEFWKGFWDNYVFVFIGVAFVGFVAFEGVQGIITAWGKAQRSSSERRFEGELDAMWERVKEAYGAAVAWQAWGRAVDASLRAPHAQGLPAPPEQELSLSNWPTLQEIRQQEDASRTAAREAAIVAEVARRRDRRERRREQHGKGAAER